MHWKEPLDLVGQLFIFGNGEEGEQWRKHRRDSWTETPRHFNGQRHIRGDARFMGNAAVWIRGRMPGGGQGNFGRQWIHY